jgi:ParB family chromosome partitioning protein
MDTRRRLAAIGDHLDESLGARRQEARPVLSPVPHQRDIGRSPLRNVGRLDLDQVIPDPDQPRTEFPEEALERLAQSIRDKGQLSPIRVRWSAHAGKWIIVAGERRWRATQHAGLATIDCYFHDQALSESQILEEQLIENCLREDLQPLEEAKAFERLMALNGWNAKQLAEAIRVHPSKVSRVLCLLKLPPAIQQQVASGEISARSAYEISKLSDKAAMQRLAVLARGGELTHRQIAGKVRQRRGKRKSGPQAMKRSFIAENGWKVVVSSNKSGSYHDMEQALCQALQEVRHYIDNGVQLY